MKRLLALLLCLVLFTAVFMTACAKDKETTEPETKEEAAKKEDKSKEEEPAEEEGLKISAPGELPLVSEPVEIKFLVKNHATVIDYQTNDFTKWMEEKTGVIINFDTVPAAGALEKVNIILASGDLPPVFYGLRMDAVQQTQFGIEEKLFIPLNKLIEEQGFFFKKALPDYSVDVMGVITAPDGNVYSMPTLTDCYQCAYSKKMWVNNVWLDNLGLEEPTTTEEYYDVLKAFKDGDPNNNGDTTDEYPLIGGKMWNGNPELFLFNSFFFYSGFDRPFSILNGSPEITVTMDEYKEALKYLNRLYSEELLYEASYTQDGSQAKMMGNNPDEQIVGSFPVGSLHAVVTHDNEHYRDYSTIAPLEGPEGVAYSLFDPYGAVVQGDFTITTACEYPEIAFKWADYLYDFESTMGSRYGIEGVQWEYPAEGLLGINGEPAKYNVIIAWGGSEPRNDNYVWTGPFNEPRWYRLGQAVEQDMDLYSLKANRVFLTKETMENYEPFEPDASEAAIAPKVQYTITENEDLLTIITEIKNAVNEYRIRYITGDLDIDDTWDEYISTLDTLGIQTWYDIYKTAYDRQFK